MQSDRVARIRDRAYQIWMAEGRVHGKHHEHWQRAEREIDAEEATSTRGARPRRGAGAAEATGGTSRAQRGASKPATPNEATPAAASRSRARIEKKAPKSPAEPKSAARGASQAPAPARRSRKPVPAK